MEGQAPLCPLCVGSPLWLCAAGGGHLPDWDLLQGGIRIIKTRMLVHGCPTSYHPPSSESKGNCADGSECNRIDLGDQEMEISLKEEKAARGMNPAWLLFSSHSQSGSDHTSASPSPLPYCDSSVLCKLFRSASEGELGADWRRALDQGPQRSLMICLVFTQSSVLKAFVALSALLKKNGFCLNSWFLFKYLV